MATARKMTVLAWHLVTKDQDYIFARPALVTHKRRKLELAAERRRGVVTTVSQALPTTASSDATRKIAGLPIETGAA